MDTSYLHSLKHRIQSRLEQAKLVSKQIQLDKENTLHLITQLGDQMELEQIKTELESLRAMSTEVIDDLLDELEVVEKYDWRYIADVQEKSTALILASYEQPLILKNVHEKIVCQLTDLFRMQTQNNLSATTVQLPPDKNPITDYSTPSFEALKSAISKFWLNHSENDTPPTQKAVSNYIAEQLGKPIRDRFTDELARAIKPD